MTPPSPIPLYRKYQTFQGSNLLTNVSNLTVSFLKQSVQTYSIHYLVTYRVDYHLPPTLPHTMFGMWIDLRIAVDLNIFFLQRWRPSLSSAHTSTAHPYIFSVHLATAYSFGACIFKIDSGFFVRWDDGYIHEFKSSRRRNIHTSRSTADVDTRPTTA